ncbi:MAG: OsmC family protein [bacterium]|nr:OsmC family protein [bacterium]
MIRKASAVWKGDLKAGKGTVSTETGTLKDTQYSFTSRFESGIGTNPEELVGAAHAGCFSMALSACLSAAGFVPDQISTTANVHLDKVETGFKITQIELVTEARVANIDEAKFQEIAAGTKVGCPISQALASVEIKLTAKLIK